MATRKADPEVRIELPTQSDAYENVFGKVGTGTRSKRGRLMKEVRNAEMKSILGAKWNVRVKNVNGDFYFVTEGTVKLWITDRTPIKDFICIGGTFFQYLYEQDPLLVLIFVRGRGNKAKYLSMF